MIITCCHLLLTLLLKLLQNLMNSSLHPEEVELLQPSVLLLLTSHLQVFEEDLSRYKVTIGVLHSVYYEL